MNKAMARYEGYAPFVRAESIVPVFQPIESLKTGQIVGFEALARLRIGDAVLLPEQFIPGLEQADLLRLFCDMLGKAIGFLGVFTPQHPGLYVSVNVETSLLLIDGFFDALQCTLDQHGHPGGNLVIELLEGDEIVDFTRMHQCLSRIRSLGLAIALDDIGSAYSSLINLRDLPIDIIKLDQSFARGLSERPEDLHFVLSFLSLARGLGKRLIVEGVETAEIHDALRVLGVEQAQGYAIARPLPLEAVADWFAARPTETLDRTPCTMLGAYAGHLLVVETCRVLMNQPLQIAWKEESKDPHSCAIGIYFDRNGLHETDYGQAHKRFHDVMACYETDMPLWQTGADDFRNALQRAISAESKAAFRCEVCVPAA
ncbi:EAL domain-containing protein [Beijerinckia sp. L45]|uniref:EAL domain-containing protein n=1 Tax=Beijerinckia sp. L45 TaxID=1641855 RepID=UPI001FEEBB43|nr:EAL domain-containing protein [Beijerinckia sp. L45]